MDIAASNRIIVVGGGVSGLSAAISAAKTADKDTQIVLLEAALNLGGRVTTVDVDGVSVDLGPEALVTYQRGIMETVHELGLSEELVAPTVNETRIYSRGKLRILPAGALQGFPNGFREVLNAGLVSPIGLLRGALDFVLPKQPLRSGESIGDIVTARFGREIAARIIDPLLGGVHAASIWQLDAELLAPQITVAYQGDSRSLIKNLRKRAAPQKTTAKTKTKEKAKAASPFRTLRGGLQTLVDALKISAETLGVSIKTSSPVVSVHQTDTLMTVKLKNGEAVTGNTVILALPAQQTAAILEDNPPEIAALPATSTATCLVSVASDNQGELIGLSGVLIPRSERQPIKAITCVTTKWGYRAVKNRVLLKCYLGHAEDDLSVTNLTDNEIFQRTKTGLEQVAKISDGVELVRVERFDRGIPQYRPGHGKIVANLEKQVRDTYGNKVLVTGAAWHGSGVGSCIANSADIGEDAAQALKESVTTRVGS